MQVQYSGRATSCNIHALALDQNTHCGPGAADFLHRTSCVCKYSKADGRLAVIYMLALDQMTCCGLDAADSHTGLIVSEPNNPLRAGCGRLLQRTSCVCKYSIADGRLAVIHALALDQMTRCGPDAEDSLQRTSCVCKYSIADGRLAVIRML
ncbi:hypothetical protein J6590_079802 [Homalodisca vitripennis]|nr:hypothetical protein J6590_079802 [Homalodisca vitripennis]